MTPDQEKVLREHRYDDSKYGVMCWCGVRWEAHNGPATDQWIAHLKSLWPAIPNAETADPWHYTGKPIPGADARKIVTLLQDGMVWVGIRAFNHHTQSWMSNNEPEKADVLAWMNLPEPAPKRWSRGQLT